MYILKVRENANSPWQLIDVLVGPRGEDGHTPEKGVDYFTQEDIDFILAEVEKGNYATVEYVDQQIENIPEVDLSNYYTKEQVDTAIENVEVDLTGYATEEYVNDAIAEAKLSGSDIDLSAYAKTADLAKVATTGNYNDLTNLPTIPSTTGLATEEYVENAVKNVKVDLSDYYTKSQVEALIPDTSNFTTMSAVEAKGYQTATQVETAINNAISAITDGEEVAY